MNAELLNRLKRLQRTRSDTSPFSSDIEFFAWADEVSPLLSFNPKLQSSFNSYVLASKCNPLSKSPYISQINEAIGILNQAVLSQEITQLHPAPMSETQKIHPSLDAPQKVTIKWLYEHVPSSLVFGGIALLASTFLAGIAFSQTHLYAFIRDAIAMPANVATIPSEIKNTTPANNPSTMSSSTK